MSVLKVSSTTLLVALTLSCAHPVKQESAPIQMRPMMSTLGGSLKDRLDSRIGLTQAALTDLLGEPYQTIPEPQGGSVFKYTMPLWDLSQNHEIPSFCHVSYHLSGKGRVTSYTAGGNNCPYMAGGQP